MEHAWKVCVRGNSYREFESHPLRQMTMTTLAVVIVICAVGIAMQTPGFCIAKRPCSSAKRSEILEKLAFVRMSKRRSEPASDISSSLG